MENQEKQNIIQHHYSQLGQDCPCTYSIPRDKITAHDPDRMPKDDAELLQWKAEFDSFVDLSPQKTECIRLLNESDRKIVSDTPYPDDVPAWEAYRTELRRIIKSDIIETIPDKPF